jgi:hypothetical protein
MNIKFDLPSIIFFIILIVGGALFLYGLSTYIKCEDKDINKTNECKDRSIKYMIIGGCLVAFSFILIITSIFYSEKKIKSLLTKNPKPSVNSSVNSSENSSILSDSILSSDYYNSETSFINPVYVPR